MRVRTKIFPNLDFSTEQIGKILLGVSLNNRVSNSADSLSQVFDWTCTHLGKCDFLVGDFLNRLTYQAFHGLAESDAIQQAMTDGERLISRIDHVAARSACLSATIISTATLMKERVALEKKAYFEFLFRTREPFKRLIEDDVAAFIKRRTTDSRIDESAYSYCIQYELEELALFEILSERGYTHLVYPGSHLRVMKALVGKDLRDISPSLERLTLVEIRLQGSS